MISRLEPVWDMIVSCMETTLIRIQRAFARLFRALYRLIAPQN